MVPKGCAMQCLLQQCWQWVLAGGMEEQRGWTMLFSHCILPADFFLTSELLSMCLIALNAFPCALFSFFLSKILIFTMLNINGFHNLICRKDQFVL